MRTFTVESRDCSDLDTLYFSLKNEKILKFCGNSYMYKDSGPDALNFICINSQCSAQLQFISESKNAIQLITGHTMESCTAVFSEWSLRVSALTKTKVKPEEVGWLADFQSGLSKTKKNGKKVNLKKSTKSKRHSTRPIQTLEGGIINISPQSLDTESPSSPPEAPLSPPLFEATPAWKLIQSPIITMIPGTPSFYINDEEMMVNGDTFYKHYFTLIRRIIF